MRKKNLFFLVFFPFRGDIPYVCCLEAVNLDFLEQKIRQTVGVDIDNGVVDFLENVVKFMIDRVVNSIKVNSVNISIFIIKKKKKNRNSFSHISNLKLLI